MTTTQETLQPCGAADRWLTAVDVGSDAWWQRLARIGTPLTERTDNQQINMSFFWRDPAGSEARSAIERVYIDVNGVTDHHSLQPESLRRLPGTDVWHWSTRIEADWRGSYSLIPVTAAQRPPRFSDDAATRRSQQREWWISLFPHAIADPLNGAAPHGVHRRRPLSLAQMPAAPDYAAWLTYDRLRPAADMTRLRQLSWQSRRLNNTRRIWIYTTGAKPAPDRPLALLLDGQNWAEGLPLFGVLDDQTAQGLLPPACWVFIDVIDAQSRERELPCHADFWLAVQEELLPLVRQYADFSPCADRTLVAGQSYGGLAALYAGLHWPQRFGRILTQSGSFWWPNMAFMRDFARREQHQPGWLTRQLQEGALPPGQLTIFQQAGNREADIAFVNQQINPALVAAGHQVNFQIYSGGHDALCWRCGLLQGLRWLLAPFSSSATGVNHD